MAMQVPNLFDFAPGELSQYAFICWLALWADPALKGKDEALHATATSFVDQLFEVSNVPKPAEYQSIEVRSQWNHIDILLIVNGDTAIIIEDKTNTKDHSDKLRRYKAVVAKEFPNCRIAAVYLKTGDQCDYGDAEQAGYGCFLRSHMQPLAFRREKDGRLAFLWVEGQGTPHVEFRWLVSADGQCFFGSERRQEACEKACATILERGGK
jgi:hypothetical protein